MHSSVNNHDTSTSILSIRELLGVIVVFALVLYLLFPKDDIESLIEGNEENTNLSINYLESMLLYYPDNIKLKMILIKNYDYAGETDKALALNQELINSTNDRALLIKLYKTQYLLEKDNYFKSEDKELLERLKERLLDYYDYTVNNRDYLFFFAEATNINYRYLKYKSLLHLMKEQPELIDYEFEKIAYYLAVELNDKPKAYYFLTHLLNYPEIEPKLQEYALNSLIINGEYERVTKIAHQLFLTKKSKGEITNFFYLALYASLQNRDRKKGEIKELIEDYISSKELLESDIYTIVNTLLQQGETKEAGEYAIKLFRDDPSLFNKKNIDLALNALTYSSKLEEAYEVVTYANIEFHTQKYLDKSIQLSLWLGRAKEVNRLYANGYHKYPNDKKYESYLLKNSDLNHAYAILGEIYKDKVAKGDYSFVKKVVEYYKYTGEIPQAEEYFEKLLEKHHNRSISKATALFSFYGGHYKKGLRVYSNYKKRYGVDRELQELAIKRAFALKEFKVAYQLSRELEMRDELKELRLFTELGWHQKDYRILHQELWRLEPKNRLNSSDYEHLISLESAYGGERLTYLYKRLWRETNNPNYLLTLLYHLIETKDENGFKETIEHLSTRAKSVLYNNIYFLELLGNYYAKNGDLDRTFELFQKRLSLAPTRIETHKSYLWFLMDNLKERTNFKKELLKEIAYLKDNPKLQEQIGLASMVASLILKKEQLAKNWVMYAIKREPENQEYQRLYQDIMQLENSRVREEYNKMINNEYTPSEIGFNAQHLNRTTTLKESHFSHEWYLYQKIRSKIAVTNYNYGAKQQTTLSLALKEQKENFSWEAKVGEIDGVERNLMGALHLGYNINRVQLNFEGAYQNKTKVTTQLEQEALENSAMLSLNYAITKRLSLGLLFQKNSYLTEQESKIGEGQQIQLSTNYIWRSRYPDITFNGYYTNNHYSKTIANNFSEFGLSTSIGKSREKSLNHSFRPFGTMGLALNNQNSLGSMLSFGLSRVLKGNDSLDILFNYSNGIGVVSEPIYGVNVNYRF